MPKTSSIVRPLIFLPLAVLLSGCALTSVVPTSVAKGLSLHGNVHGGQQPIAGASVYLYQAGSSFYGAPSQSLLTVGGAVLSDGTNGYVVTDAGGNWDISGDYSCTPNSQVYLYVNGGDAGVGAGTNSAIGLMAVLGNCPNAGNFAVATPFITINEISTVAAAYAMAPFAVDALHVASSGSPLALTGIANAFANASNLVDLPSGNALSTTLYGNGTVPTSTINTLANVIAACVNSTGSDGNCTLLLGDATSTGTISGTAPSDTATAMINIAKNPGANMTDLFNLPTPTSPFAPTLSVQPNDFSLAITYTDASFNSPTSVSIDSSGNAWILNTYNNSITLLSSLGIPAGNSPLSGNGLYYPMQLALDESGNAWVANIGNTSLSEFDLTGTPVYGSPFANAYYTNSIAVDPLGDVWVVSPSNEVSLVTPGLTPSFDTVTTGNLNDSDAVGIDSFGNAWVANYFGNSVNIYSGTGIWSGEVTGDGLSNPQAISVDNFGNAWIANGGNTNSITVVNGFGNVMAGSPFSGGGVNVPSAVAFDGLGNAWVSNSGGSGVTELSSTGVAATGSPFSQPALTLNSSFVAVDGSGSVWVTSQYNNTVVEIIGSAAPAVTPIAYAVASGTVGTLP